jgi:hypothetical protein
VWVLATNHLQHWRNEGSAFLDRILMVDESWIHSFDPWLKQQNTEWHAQMSPRKKTAWHSQGALKVMHVMLFSLNGLVLDHPMPVGTMAHGQISAHTCRIRRLAFRCKQSELLEHGIILLQDNAKVIAIMICKIWCSTGAERCWHNLPALHI